MKVSIALSESALRSERRSDELDVEDEVKEGQPLDALGPNPGVTSASRSLEAVVLALEDGTIGGGAIMLTLPLLPIPKPRAADGKAGALNPSRGAPSSSSVSPIPESRGLNFFSSIAFAGLRGLGVLAVTLILNMLVCAGADPQPKLSSALESAPVPSSPILRLKLLDAKNKSSSSIPARSSSSSIARRAWRT